MVTIATFSITVGRADDSGSSTPPDVCYEIGSVSDGERREQLNSCTAHRQRLLYRSHNNHIEIELHSSVVLRGLKPFIIHYRGR